MVKQTIIRLAICAIISILNVSKDFYGIAKMQAKQHVCEMNLDNILNHKWFQIVSIDISKEELRKLNIIKDTYCNSN